MTRAERFYGAISETRNSALYAEINQYVKPFGFCVKGGFYEPETNSMSIWLESLNSTIGSGRRNLTYKLKGFLAVKRLMVNGFAI